MRRILKQILLTAAVSVILTACGCPSCMQKKACRTFIDAKTAAWSADEQVNQIIFVFGTEGSEAKVVMMTRRPDGKWKKALSCDAFIGRNGLGKTHEGDGKTPVGDFGILQAFGIKPNPGTAVPYLDVTPDLYCCGDTVAYNRFIDIREYPHKCEGEHMIEYVPSYNYGFFPDYNAECVFGLGSAIFFHCTGSKPYTAGCVAVSEKNMVRILKAIDSSARLVIDYMPGR